MKKKFLKTLVVANLCASFLSTNVYAENITVNQDTDLNVNPASVTVTATVESTYSVAIPKVMNLVADGEGDYVCNYAIDIIDANIDVAEHISVIPDAEVTLSTPGKDDVILTVTQPVTNFKCHYYRGDLSSTPDTVKVDATGTTPEASGTIVVKDGYELTAGVWEGPLTFDISLEND